MFERFTDRARHVLVLAQEQARELNYNFIGTEHVLLGLIAEGEGVASRVLTSFGLSLEAAQAKIVAIVGPGTDVAAGGGKPPFTPRSKKVLEYALREALGLGHKYIGTEHLLLGVIREGEGVGAKVLLDSGIALTEVRDRVIDALGAHSAAAGTALPRRLSPASIDAMSHARRLAKEQPLTTGQLLAGILSVERSHAAQALAALGITGAAVEAKLREIPLDTTSDAGPRPQTVEIKLGPTTTVIADPELAATLQHASAEELRRALGQIARNPRAEPPPAAENDVDEPPESG